MDIKTPHYEFFSTADDIMIYGVDVEEIFPDGADVTPDICEKIEVSMPDVMVKCTLTTYKKKGIMVYSKEKEVLHIGYNQILQLFRIKLYWHKY